MLQKLLNSSVLSKSMDVQSLVVLKRTFYLSSSFLTKCPPRNRANVERRWRKKTNLIHFFPMTRSWHNIIQCDSCGGYHRKWLLCSTCYDQTRYETETLRKVLKEKGEDLSQATVLKYQDDINKDFSQVKEKVFTVDKRNRPKGWFNEAYWNAV